MTGLRKPALLNCIPATQQVELPVANAPAPEFQIAFNRGRKEAQTSRFEDDAAVRSQTIRMYDRLSEFQDVVSAKNNVELACRRGCTYCCHLRVEIRPHDAFVLEHHIQ